MRCALITLFWIASLGLRASANDAIWQEYRDYMIGEWVTQGVLPEGMIGAVAKPGDRYRMFSHFESGLDGKTLVGTQLFKIVDKPDYLSESHYVAGWDPKSETIRIDVYWSDGDIDRSIITRKEGNTYVSTYTFIGGTGETLSCESRQEIINRDSFVFKAEGMPDGKWNRVSKEDATAKAQAYLQYFAYFLGEWMITDEAGVQIGTFTIEQSPAAHSHRVVHTLDSEIVTGEYGFDPATQGWSGSGYTSNGSRWCETLRKPDGMSVRPGDVMNYSGSESAIDGTQTLFEMRLEVVDSDTFVVTNSATVVPGQDQATVRKSTYKRKK